MPSWLIKSATHRAISILPCSQRWNELLQTHVTKSLVFTPAGFSQRLDCCRIHLEHFFAASPGREQFTALELGTGWYPVVPVGLFLCGASEVWTYDIAPLLQRGRVERTLRAFYEFAADGALQQRLPWVIPERLERLREALESAATSRTGSHRALLESLNIHLFVQDARATGLASASVDLFVSTGVLEYIPRPTLAGLFREFRRICVEGAVMCHQIDLSDEFAYFDPSIGAFNFLRYSSRRWKYLDSPIVPQNRLRISDYRQVISEAGFVIVSETNTDGKETELAGIRLAPEFQAYSKADLLVIRSTLVAQPAPADASSAGAPRDEE
ncbi:MAG: class I SAM-dependent methyltransferase [Actinomycetota bacterium]|nr:class I SAM-dependent methyltransferase [Actinomycetota bacterium]